MTTLLLDGPAHPILPTSLHWPRSLKTAQAAAYTGIAESTLEKMRVYGGGPHFTRIGRSIRYLIDDLDGFLVERRCGSTSEYTRH